jgi:hypothetical protein
MGNDDYAFMIAVHELVEWYLTEKRGIKEEDVKAFDEMFEKERARGLHAERDGAGDDSRAPYFKEHVFATDVEKQLARELGIDWNKYDTEISALFAKFEASEATKAGASNIKFPEGR